MNQVVCFGEVLWDLLPSGAKPGGAPMNVAYHLNKLGSRPVMLTRIGLDDWGRGLLQLMEDHGMTTRHFQIDPFHATGTVLATIGEHHEVSYDIVQPVAWDYIEWQEEMEAQVRDARFFVYGSLAARSAVSRETLFRLLEAAPFRVLDINLRPPHYDRQRIEALLQRADLLKLNLAELELVTGWFSSYRNAADRMAALQDRFRIPTIVVTRGAEGAIFRHEGNTYQHPGFRVEVVDTVGSGDAFFAGLLHQYAQGADPQHMLLTASALGALVAGKAGPCPVYDITEISALVAQQAISN